MFMIGGKCACLRAKAAHISSGHLPIGHENVPVGQSIEKITAQPFRSPLYRYFVDWGKGRHWLSTEGRRPLGFSDERDKSLFPLRTEKFPCQQSSGIQIPVEEPIEGIDRRETVFLLGTSLL